VFWLLAAIDGHAKNISTFLTPGGYRLTPLYDVMSAALYPQFLAQKAKLAMSFGDRGITNDITGVHAKANDAPCELVHDHEHPVGVEQNRLTTKKIGAPKTVFKVADKRQPGRAVIGIGSRVVMLYEHAPHNMYVVNS